MMKDKKVYEELIKIGVDAELSSVKDVLTDEEVLEMGYSLPPEDMFDKVKETYAAKKAAEKPVAEKGKKRVNIRRIILIAAVLTILSVAIAVSTTGYKQYQQNSRERIEDNAIRMSGSNNAAYTRTPEEIDAYEKAEQTLGVTLLKPTDFSDEFEFSKIKFYESTSVIITYKNQNNTIRLTQSLLGNSYAKNEAIDATDRETYTINAHGTAISVKEHTPNDTDIVWLSATWYGENLMYKVDSNCSREEFNKFIENLK